jgi:type IV secretion system protein VirD4
VGKARTTTAIAATALCIVGTLYLSGWLALMFLGLDPANGGLGTYLDYLRHIGHPAVARYSTRIFVAGAIAASLMLLVWGSLMVMLFKLRSHRDIHGRARFAGLMELASRGFLRSGEDGIVVGRMHGRLLRLPGQQFVILAAPTRSGKGVGVVIPNLLDYRESAVVLDIKQENFDLTSGWRRSIGHDVYLFNPFAEDRRTHRWNPLTYISPDPATRISDIQAIAAMLYPDGDDKDRFWCSQARNAFVAFTLYLFETRDAASRDRSPGDGPPHPTLGAVLRLASGDGSELKTYLQGLVRDPAISADTRTAFSGLLSQADVTFASIIGTFREPLNAWLNPVLDAATSGDDFRLDEVRRRRMTIYVGIQPNKLAESRLVLNLFFSQLINVNTRDLPQNDPGLRHQCLLLMDEFTSIGRVDIISRAVAYMAGYNLRLLPIIQSMAQLEAVYGKELSRTIITNHALQIIFAPREQQDANDYSEMLGYRTIMRRARTRSHGDGKHRSDNEVLEKRALMLPQELKAMGPEKQILLYEGLANPVLCRKIRYYRDGYFTRRLRPKVEVAPLQVPAPRHGGPALPDPAPAAPSEPPAASASRVPA